MAGKNGNPWPWVLSAALLGGLAGTCAVLAHTWKTDALARSRTLTVAAQAALDRADFESASRYALAAMKGHDQPIIGFDARTAEAILAGAVADSTIRAERLTSEDPIVGIAYSPDDRYLATATEGLVQVYDAKTLRPMAKVSLGDDHDAAKTLAFSADGHTLTARFTGAPKAWAFEVSATGQARLTPSRPGVGSLWPEPVPSFMPMGYVRRPLPEEFLTASPDGRTAVSDDDTVLHIRDVASGRVRSIDIKSFGEIHDGISQALFATDNKTLAITAGDAMLLVDSATLKLMAFQRLDPGNGTLLAFSPDGRRLAVDTAGGVRIFDGQDLEPTGFAFQQVSIVITAAFSPDGKTLAISGGDGDLRFVDLVWQPDRSVDLPRYYPHSDVVPPSVDSSVDGRRALVTDNAGGADRTQLWNLATGRQEAMALSAPGVFMTAGVSGDGGVIMSADETQKSIAFVDVLTGQALPIRLDAENVGFPVILTKDRRFVIFPTRHDTVEVRDLSHPGAVPSVYRSGGDDPNHVVLSPDDHTLFIPDGSDGKGYLVDVRTGRRLRDATGLEAFSNDGVTFLTEGTTRGKGAQVWDTQTGRPLTPPIDIHDVSYFGWLPKSRVLILVGMTGIRFWDAGLQRFIGQPLHGGTPQAVLIDGDRVAMIDASHRYVRYTLPAALTVRGPALITEACRRVLPGDVRRFRDEEMATTPLLTAVDRDVCR